MNGTELKPRMEALGLYNGQTDAELEALASEVQDHVNSGCPTVEDAILVTIREGAAGQLEADRTHGSGFREA